MLKVPPAVAAPEPATADVHVAFVYSVTVERGSAVPLIAGVLLFAGELGVVAVGVGLSGTRLSITKFFSVKCATSMVVSTFPALSVARQWIVYVPSGGVKP